MSLTIRHLLMSMAGERQKAKTDEDDDYVHIQQMNSQWPRLFDVYFLSPKTRLTQTDSNTTSDDDLVFYVTRQVDNDFHHPLHLVEVVRHHDTKRQPKLGAPEYDWEETTNLNLVLHQFEYTVTTAVCTKTSNKHLQILKRLSTKVYASPSRRDMESKGTEEKITYPNIYFTVDNFEDTFCEMVVNEGQMVCVELVAKNPLFNEPRVLFLGSIKYEALKKVYETRASTSTRVAQRMSLGMYTKRRVEFVRMRGPNGKGHAEMAVSRARTIHSGITTPESVPSTPMSSSFDEESWNKRRLMESSTTSRWIPPTSRQQPMISNVTTPEVESTDIHQELSDDAGGFLGRTLSQAMSWMRGSNSRLNQPMITLSLQTCLTYLTLPCQFIVKDVLESNQMPILTF